MNMDKDVKKKKWNNIWNTECDLSNNKDLNVTTEGGKRKRIKKVFYLININTYYPLIKTLIHNIIEI